MLASHPLKGPGPGFTELSLSLPASLLRVLFHDLFSLISVPPKGLMLFTVMLRWLALTVRERERERACGVGCGWVV
jgi:hypothetical protein